MDLLVGQIVGPLIKPILSKLLNGVWIDFLMSQWGVNSHLSPLAYMEAHIGHVVVLFDKPNNKPNWRNLIVN